MTVTAHRFRALLAIVFGAAVLLVGFPAEPANAATSPRELELDFLALTNVERAKAGLGALSERTDIRTVARSHSDRMARESRLFHNPDFTTEITGWQRVSENVGYGPNVERIHQALMNSEGHRRNILDDRVTEVGIGVVVDGNRVWVTQNFRRPLGEVSPTAPSSSSFGDVPAGSTHASAIERISAQGIADPCGSSRFCPVASVTRAEFSKMLVRALELPRATYPKGRFDDVDDEQALDAEALEAAGLTNGCSATRFCPDARLSRAQMAAFFARALLLNPVPSSFSDVGSTHDGSVGALERAGIVNGCGVGRFCPAAEVTRAQTATMLDRNLR